MVTGGGQCSMHVRPPRGAQAAVPLLLALPLAGNALVPPQVAHKTMLEVAEMGTEAAAATGIKMVFLSGKVGPLTVVNFNRPFLVFLLSGDTGSVMFGARVANPKQA